MTNTTTSNVLTTGSLDSFINRAAVRNYQDKRFFLNFAKKVNKPAGYTSATFYKPKDMSGSTAALTEGTTPTATGFTLTPVVVPLTQYGNLVTLTDLALDDSPIDLIEEAANELGNDAARKLDIACQEVIDGGSNVIYSSVGDASTARNQIDATDILNIATIAKAVSYLQANDAPMFGKGYIAVMHPHVWHDVAVEAGEGSIVSPTVYTGGDNPMFAGEVGMLPCGVRVVVSSNVQFFADASDGAGGSGNIDVYPTYIFGKDAFACAMAGGIETFVQGLGKGDDPLHQRFKIGYKTRAGFSILKEEGLYRIETASSIGANS